MKEIISKDKPHQDIGKSKFRVRQQYVTWVEYDVVSKRRSTKALPEQGIDKIEYLKVSNDNPVK